MKNRIIRNVDSILSFVLMVVIFFVWSGLARIGVAFLKLARNASNIYIWAQCHIRLGKIHDNYECAKENVDCMNRMFRYKWGETFKELLTEMFKVEA